MAILGPKTSIRKSQRVAESGMDIFIEPLGVWPTDHKAVWIKISTLSSIGLNSLTPGSCKGTPKGI